MDKEVVVVPEGDNRKPAEIALSWLMAQNLKPGDVVILEDLDRAMCLVDPNALQGRKAMTKWALNRLAIFQQVLDRFEEQTGEILLSVGRGRLVVAHHEEVAQQLFEPAYAQILRIFTRTAARINQATKEGISPDEHARRNAATSKISDMRSFMMRRQRKRLSD